MARDPNELQKYWARPEAWKRSQIERNKQKFSAFNLPVPENNADDVSKLSKDDVTEIMAQLRAIGVESELRTFKKIPVIRIIGTGSMEKIVIETASLHNSASAAAEGEHEGPQPLQTSADHGGEEIENPTITANIAASDAVTEDPGLTDQTITNGANMGPQLPEPAQPEGKNNPRTLRADPDARIGNPKINGPAVKGLGNIDGNKGRFDKTNPGDSSDRGEVFIAPIPLRAEYKLGASDPAGSEGGNRIDPVSINSEAVVRLGASEEPLTPTDLVEERAEEVIPTGTIGIDIAPQHDVEREAGEEGNDHAGTAAAQRNALSESEREPAPEDKPLEGLIIAPNKPLDAMTPDTHDDEIAPKIAPEVDGGLAAYAEASKDRIRRLRALGWANPVPDQANDNVTTRIILTPTDAGQTDPQRYEQITEEFLAAHPQYKAKPRTDASYKIYRTDDEDEKVAFTVKEDHIAVDSKQYEDIKNAIKLAASMHEDGFVAHCADRQLESIVYRALHELEAEGGFIKREGKIQTVKILAADQSERASFTPKAVAPRPAGGGTSTSLGAAAGPSIN